MRRDHSIGERLRVQAEINCASTRSVVHILFRALAQQDVPVVERPMENMVNHGALISTCHVLTAIKAETKGYCIERCLFPYQKYLYIIANNTFTLYLSYTIINRPSKKPWLYGFILSSIINCRTFDDF